MRQNVGRDGYDCLAYAIALTGVTVFAVELVVIRSFVSRIRLKLGTSCHGFLEYWLARLVRLDNHLNLRIDLSNRKRKEM